MIVTERAVAELPILNVASVHDRLGVSERAARLALLDLAEAGIIRQLNVGRCRRAYVATEVFDLVNRFGADAAVSCDKVPDGPARLVQSDCRAASR